MIFTIFASLNHRMKPITRTSLKEFVKKLKKKKKVKQTYKYRLMTKEALNSLKEIMKHHFKKTWPTFSNLYKDSHEVSTPMEHNQLCKDRNQLFWQSHTGDSKDL